MMRTASIGLALALAMCAGCATPARRPYSAGERRALVHAITGQALDTVTTSMMLQDDRVSEANPIWWDARDAGSILAGKVVVMGATYLLLEWKPELRRTMWWMFAGGGYAAAAWNTGLMIRHDVRPWE
jgi:hypothetical protein